MRRSLLFIPGNNPAMIQNYDVFDQDAVIFDLEDAVISTEKDAARELVNQLLKAFDPTNVEIIVRINAVGSEEYFQDLALLESKRIDTLMIPKANLTDMKKVLADVREIEKQFHLKPIGFIPIIETAKAIYDIDKLASFNRVSGLLLGAEDLATDLEIKRTEEGLELLYIRSKIAIAAKVHQIDAIDTPYIDVSGEKGLIKDAESAKQLGMNAKACIHPNQVISVNRVFSPAADDIRFARRVLAAADKAAEQQLGAFSLDGKMVDKPIIDRAKKTLERAQKFRLI